MLGNHNPQLLPCCAQIDAAHGVAQTEDFGTDDISGPKALNHYYWVDHFFSNVLSSDSSLHGLHIAFVVAIDFVDLQNLYLALLLFNLDDFAENNVAYLQADFLVWKTILDVNASLLSINHSIDDQID